MAKKTPLYETHVKYGGQIVEFAGYELPVQYEGHGLIKEHTAVRTAAGLLTYRTWASLSSPAKTQKPLLTTCLPTT